MAQQCTIPNFFPFPHHDDKENMWFGIAMTDFHDGESEINKILKNEKPNLKVNGSIKDYVRLTRSDINTLSHDVCNSAEFLQITKNIYSCDLKSIGSGKYKIEQFLDVLSVTCQGCMEYEKVTEIAEIKPGNHIRFHRMYSGINFYNHHAIVIEVTESETDVTQGEMTLVHFHKNNRGVITVVKETEKFNMKTQHIDIVKYKFDSYTAAEIIERANRMAHKFKKGQQAESYSFLGNNCEDNSHEIATGSKNSQQVTAVTDYVKSTIAWLLKLFLKVAIRFVTRIKQYIRGFVHITVIFSLFTIIDQITGLDSKREKGLLCLDCYNKEYTKLMISLLFCLISVGISVVSHVGLTYFAISTVIATALPVVSSLINDAVMPFIHPAYNVSKQVVGKADLLQMGDVITFPYFGFDHEGVITEITSSDNQSNVVKVTAVHYNYAGLFGTRTVVEEVFFFDLARENVYVYNFREYHTYPPKKVVERAKEKIGSQHFNMFYNRSSHLSRLCKTEQDTSSAPCKKVSQMEELSPGDVIGFKYCKLSHEAVVTKVQHSERIKCKVVHYSYNGANSPRTVVEESFQFHLSEQNLYVHVYPENSVHLPDDVVALARSRVGEQKFHAFINRSSHLARFCKIKTSYKT